MVSDALAGVLASRRALLNQRVAEARHRQPTLDTAAFGAFVTGTLDAVCVAVDAIDPLATIAAVEAAFDIGLTLVGQGLAGPSARLPWVDRAWQELAPAIAPLLVQAPAETLGAIANAIVRLDSVRGVRVGDWIDTMRELAPRCRSLDELRALGALCAWRAGMAHLREPALAQAAQLGPTLATAALGAPAMPWTDLRERVSTDRWWNPMTGDVNAQGHTVGGFSGLDGPFAVPPEVRGGSGHFVAESAGRHFLLIADAFGAVVLPASPGEFAQAAATQAPGVSITPRGGSLHGRDIAFAVPGERMKAVADADSVAFFSPWSHYVRIMPARA
jgi:hypothetical protein